MYYATNQITNWSGGDVATTPTYSVGGAVSGLSGTVVLQDNGTDSLSVAANGAFAFPAKLHQWLGVLRDCADAAVWPDLQAVTGGSGTIGVSARRGHERVGGLHDDPAG